MHQLPKLLIEFNRFDTRENINPSTSECRRLPDSRQINLKKFDFENVERFERSVDSDGARLAFSFGRSFFESSNNHYSEKVISPHSSLPLSLSLCQIHVHGWCGLRLAEPAPRRTTNAVNYSKYESLTGRRIMA